jgi:hypothetical protein
MKKTAFEKQSLFIYSVYHLKINQTSINFFFHPESEDNISDLPVSFCFLKQHHKFIA